MTKKAKALIQQKMSFIEVHRRKQIIDIAIEIIAKQGYQQTTLASVAKQAGFSKGVIFYYFKNKDELIDQINLTLLDELKEYTRIRLKSHQNEKDRLKAYVDVYLGFIKENQGKFMILAELGINFNLKSKDLIFNSTTYVECRKSLGKIMDMTPKKETQRQFKPDTYATVIQGMLDGVGIQWVTDPDLIDLDECRELIIQMIDNYFS